MTICQRASERRRRASDLAACRIFVPESGALSELPPRCPGRYGGRNGVLETMNIRPDYAAIAPEEFFAWVSGQEGRYELVEGEVVMMAGAGRRLPAGPKSSSATRIAVLRASRRSSPTSRAVAIQTESHRICGRRFSTLASRHTGRVLTRAEAARPGPRL